MSKQIVFLAMTALALTACSTTTPQQDQSAATHAPIEDRTADAKVVVVPSTKGGYLPGDGPGDSIPANLDAIPDAVPVNEPPHRYANQPYTALENSYTPMSGPGNYKQRGIASWYGKKFHGQRTSSGEKYDMYLMTAAHPTLPIPSYARVTNVATQKSVVVRINDRGPFLHKRLIDLSYVAAHKLGIIGSGSSEVEVESIVPGSRTTTLARTEVVRSVPLEPAVVPVVGKEPVNTTPVVSSNVFLQLGAFSSSDAAERFLQEMRVKLGNVGKQLMLFSQAGKTRVHIGPYANESEARNSREGLRDKLGIMPILSLH